MTLEKAKIRLGTKKETSMFMEGKKESDTHLE